MSLETAKTEFVEANGVRYAYRRMGLAAGTPLVFLQHFTGNMDAWDPAVVNALAETRPVIVFNNAGVATSAGSTPDNVEQMASNAVSFIKALGLQQVDLLGFSLGGIIAQVIAVTSANLVRKIIMAGTAARGGEEHLLSVVEAAFAKGASDVRLPLFFTPSKSSQAAGARFIGRALARRDDRDLESGSEVSDPQAKAIIDWCANKDEGASQLRAIKQPTLIVHGSDDTMFPSINAYDMFKSMPDAHLILYPDAGHGALFQHPAIFVAHCRTFLDLEGSGADL